MKLVAQVGEGYFEHMHALALQEHEWMYSLTMIQSGKQIRSLPVC